MNYFKIKDNHSITDVGFTFLKWNDKYHEMHGCDIEDAQFAMSSITHVIYRDGWMRPTAAPAEKYQTGTVVMIDAVEYDELYAQLSEGESIDEPEEKIPVPVEPVQPEPEEKPMTVAEMRETIIEQQEQIDMLTECLLEMSELVYGG